MSGALNYTGRPLDVALLAGHWRRSSLPGNGEAYTLAAFRPSANGQLTVQGMPLRGGGRLLPPSAEITIDGTISALNPTDPPDTIAIGRLKLVKADARE